MATEYIPHTAPIVTNVQRRDDFYVYALFREDGTPFYLGKGNRDRWTCHEREARRGTSSYKCAIIRGMQLRGVDLIKIKIHEGLTEAAAHDYEVALIAAIGRGEDGPLVNMTDGGDGVSGYVPTAETRMRIGIAQRGKKKLPESIAKGAAARRGRKISAEHIAKTATANRGRKLSSEHRAKISQGQRGRKPASPETRAKISLAKTGIKRSQETIKKMSEAARGRIVSSETRAKISASNSGKRSPKTEETRARLSIALKTYYELQRTALVRT